MRYRRYFGTAVTLAALVPFVTGCSDDGTTGPDDDGSVEAMVTDDPGSGSASISSRDARFSQSFAGSTFQGEFQGQARVQISADGATWIDLGPAQNVSFTMQSSDDAVVNASATVPARSYTRVRLILSDADATVEAGSTIGGITLDANVLVSVNGGSEFMVEKTASFTVTADSETTVLFDLNSESWIDETAVTTQTATSAAVQSATTVVVQ